MDKTLCPFVVGDGLCTIPTRIPQECIHFNLHAYISQWTNSRILQGYMKWGAQLAKPFAIMDQELNICKKKILFAL